MIKRTRTTNGSLPFTTSCTRTTRSTPRPPSTPARVLELGVRTGRIAIPLVERGYEVRGIGASARCWNSLPARTRRAASPPSSTTTTGRKHDLILVVLSTFSAVTREQQTSCLRGIHK
ncbi:hypothetical protein ACQSSU_19175 [Micromonospora echinospora]